MINKAIFAAVVIGLVTDVAVSQDLNEVDFQSDIAPIFEQHCFECHGVDSREGGLRLTNRTDALAESDSGRPAIVPGHSKKSELVSRIVSDNEDLQMPPSGERLTVKQIKAIQRWIDAGAVWPDSEAAKHWAYEKPQRPSIPDFPNSKWARNPIDQFVLRKLRREGLKPAAEESPAKLLRRVGLMLTGLPPTVSQVDTFLDDPSEQAYEAFVDQCLESPRYGERWAQPWLDLARYADSNGFQADQLRESWAYRDWVIAAMNSDMPFDQFTVEQLAGDLLDNPTIEQKIATGFHRTVTCNVEAGVHPEENRVNQIFDRVNTTSTVFLGTTMECCQCHNHKYDPFTQDEYYQLFAYFNNTPLEVKLDSGVQYNFYGPKMDLPLEADAEKQRDQLKHRLAELEEKLSALDSSESNSRSAIQRRFRDLIESSEDNWQVVEIVEFESSGGEEHEVLDDHSVLIGGSLPGTSVYKIIAKTDLDKVSAFRLEALTHESLPGTGPGRGDDKRPNFILSEFTVAQWLDQKDGIKSIPLESATADYSQKNWEVAKAIDGNRKTGWAIGQQFFKPHYAVFEPSSPVIRSTNENKFRFVLDQNYGRGRTLGRIRLSVSSADPAALAIPEDIREILLKDKLTKKQQIKLDAFLDSADPLRKKIDRQIRSLRKQLDAVTPSSTLVMVEMDTMRDTFKLIRGDYLNPGKQVDAGVPSVLHSLNPSLPQDRLGLATWIVDPENPLLARVTVNRWWSEFFGKGLVTSAEDFGTQCEPPSHPELLDWLATEFIHRGWSRKKMHKVIVMSSTFRQSSKVSSQLLDVDPENKFYARGPRFRMPAEMVRDNGLAISGLLSTQMGGPPIMPFQPENIWRAVGRNAPKWQSSTDENRFRRGVYVVWRRAAPYPSFVNFDAPDRAACVVERPRTNTPLQALTLLNDQAYLEMAAALASKVSAEPTNADIETRIESAFRRCVARKPASSEIEILMNLYDAELARFKKDKNAAKAMMKTLGQHVGAKMMEPKTAALTVVCNALLNLDETINY